MHPAQHWPRSGQKQRGLPGKNKYKESKVVPVIVPTDRQTERQTDRQTLWFITKIFLNSCYLVKGGSGQWPVEPVHRLLQEAGPRVLGATGYEYSCL